ncbi:AraC family transcriptional regulator [Microbacterium pseudoresistens]|uniref:AraC-like DNA-binding protein n=1 Tax=Microbacterium pseudoresistens TaxID=640634 RepID=A0A7Y9EWY9_9MICO|nr:helix-turn-helix domain-containing protein [Microbacterium pseudoresistens]NYD54575.1 AraC-like DNA-binding protein [Microbacterium pseudoresistens]
MRISARRHDYGGVTLWALAGDATEFEVRPDEAHDAIAFAFVDAGSPASRLDGEPWLQINSGMIIAPDGIARRLRFESPWRASVVLLPRPALTAFVTRLPTTIWWPRERRTLDLAMQAFVTALAQPTHDATAIETYAAEQLLLEMAGAVLLDRLGADTPAKDPATALRDRALAVIAQQCADSELTPARVAHDSRTSLRRLQNVFAESDLTVAGEIRRHRARLARSLLIDSRFDVLSVEQIAQRSGFGTTMSLRRALHEVYDASPRSLRRARGHV